MARRDVVDVDEVQAGLDERRHPAGRGFDDDAAGRRRLHVARPDRRRGIDDHRGKPVARDHVGDEVLGDDLAALVGADRFGCRQMPGLVGEAAGAQVEGRDRAGVDDPLDARAQRLLHDDPGAFDIGAQEIVGGGRPEPVVGRGMNEIACAVERRRDRGAVEKVADHDLVARIDVDPRARRADQNADRDSRRRETPPQSPIRQSRWRPSPEPSQAPAILTAWDWNLESGLAGKLPMNCIGARRRFHPQNDTVGDAGAATRGHECQPRKKWRRLRRQGPIV